MNNEKEIKEIAEVLSSAIEYDEWSAREYGQSEVDFDTTAYNLVNAGYGNVKQAVKEFAEKVVDTLDNYQYDDMTVREIVDNLMTELYGGKTNE